MDRLKNKIALISGDARDELTKQTAEAINAMLGANTVLAVHLDVTRAADWHGAVETCVREFGGLDILVNNAGIANRKGLEQTSEEEWDAIVNVNQKGVWLGMKTAISAMRKRGGGSIINISSIFGLV